MFVSTRKSQQHIFFICYIKYVMECIIITLFQNLWKYIKTKIWKVTIGIVRLMQID